MQLTANLLSIQVGMPQDMASELDESAKPWTSGIVKQPTDEPLWLSATQLAGDGQADMVNHGGIHKAVCAYAAAHYPNWRRELQLPDWTWGAFGENFTVQGVTEADLCVGDVWGLGAARLQISQPRQPCWKLARRWNIKDLASQVQKTGRTGWYFRVLDEGLVHRGMTMTLMERTCPEWTIAAANQVMHHDKANRRAAVALAAVESLSPSWREALRKRALDGSQPNVASRLLGPSQ